LVEKAIRETQDMKLKEAQVKEAMENEKRIKDAKLLKG